MAAQLHTEGRQWIFEVCFTEEQSVPDNLYVGLCTDTSIAENAVLADLGELSDTDYERFALVTSTADWTSAATGTNDRKMTSDTVTFEVVSSGVTWTKAESWFLATTINDSGKLIASGPLNSGSGWTLDFSEENNTLNFDIELVWL